MKENEFTVVPTYGEPYLLIDTVFVFIKDLIVEIRQRVVYKRQIQGVFL